MSKYHVLLNKTLVIGILVLFIGMSINPSSGINIEKKYSMPISNGNTLYVGGSGPNNYTFIQDAINDSSDGDTVFVYDDSSPYYENLIVDKSINLTGENKDTTIIKGDENYDVILIKHDGVIISRFSIKDGSNGIRLNSVGNVEIRQVNIYNNSYNGIYIENYIENVVVHHTIIYNNRKKGIIISRCKNQSYDIIIHDNIIKNNLMDEFFLFIIQSSS